jgi:hypothetical protein
MIALKWPCTGPLTQGFGENPQNYAKFGLAGHNGIDLGVSIGTMIGAAEEGKVIRAKWDTTGYGNYVKLQHNDTLYGNYYTLYAHLNSYTVSVGQTVYKGQTIGYSGNTGNSTGPHLHFELELPWSNNYGYNNRVDPIPYMEAVMPDGTMVTPGTGTVTKVVSPGTAVVDTIYGINIRPKPDEFGETIGSLRDGFVLDWDGEMVKDSSGRMWLKVQCYVAEEYMAYNESEKKLDPFIGFHRNLR